MPADHGMSAGSPRRGATPAVTGVITGTIAHFDFTGGGVSCSRAISAALSPVMGLPAEKPRRAAYAELEAVPPHMVAEIVDGVLHVFPRPAPPHAYAASGLGMDIGGPFDRGRGGPGGWRILDEPELHFGPADEEDVVVPDLTGWRLERMPKPPSTTYFALAPDWVCEVLSPSTESFDRTEKMPIYAREGVRHAWLVNPLRRTLEVFRLGTDGLWDLLGVHHGSAIVRAEPFDAVELALSGLWTDIESAMMEEYEKPTPHTSCTS